MPSNTNASVIRIRLNAAGVASASAPLISTKVDPQIATTKVISKYARSFISLDSFRWRTRVALLTACHGGGFVSFLAGDKRLHDRSVEDIGRRSFVDIAVEQDEISIVA